MCDIVDRPDRPGEYSEDCNKYFPVHWLVNGAQYRVVRINKVAHASVRSKCPRTAFFSSELMATAETYSPDFYMVVKFRFSSASWRRDCPPRAGHATGSIAGYYGGWIDSVVMRGAELFLVLPWIYLLFALRAFLPLNWVQARPFCTISVIGVVGWARPPS